MQHWNDSDVVDFDAAKAVGEYRNVLDHMEGAATPDAKEEFVRIARRMRQKWQTWQGEDSLHEMAFGEPDE